MRRANDSQRSFAVGAVASEPSAVPPAVGRPLPERVTDSLRSAILAGRRPPGQEFSLRHTADEFGISFIPVREALRTLEAEGLLRIRPGRSAIVAPLSPGELAATFRLRRLIEPPRVALTVRLHRPGELDQLELLLRTCSDSTATPDEHARAHQLLHTRLLRSDATTADHRIFTMLQQVTSRYVRMATELVSAPPEQHRAFGNSHRDLLAAVRTGEPEIARASTITHLDQLERIATAALLAKR
jgi:DNA-binding GntR family transcriptional regulator